MIGFPCNWLSLSLVLIAIVLLELQLACGSSLRCRYGQRELGPLLQGHPVARRQEAALLRAVLRVEHGHRGAARSQRRHAQLLEERRGPGRGVPRPVGRAAALPPRELHRMPHGAGARRETVHVQVTAGTLL